MTLLQAAPAVVRSPFKGAAAAARAGQHGTTPGDDGPLGTLVERAITVAAAASARLARTEVENGFPAAEFQDLAGAGLLVAPLPRGHGGAGLGREPGTVWATLSILRILGRGNLSVARLYEGHINAIQLVGLFGTPEQNAQLAEDVRARQLRWAIWNTDDRDGVLLEPLSHGRYRLRGAKQFASGAGAVERALITGRLPDGRRQLCAVPLHETTASIDASAWHPLGMAASVSYRVDFSGVELPTEALIGAPDDYLRQPWLTAGAARFAAAQLGGAQALFDAHRAELAMLGRTDHPLQRARAGEMAIALEAGLGWLAGAAACYERHPGLFTTGLTLTTAEVTEIVTYANMMRLAIEATCMQTRDLVERSVGMRGMLQPHPIERISRDLTMYLRQPAPDAALAQVGEAALSRELTW